MRHKPHDTPPYRRYAACDPDNRLIAAQLEKNWETALRRDLEGRQPTAKQAEIEVDPNAFANLAENLSEAWNAPGVTMRARQQLLRALIVDIIVDVDEKGARRGAYGSLARRPALRAACAQAANRRTWLRDFVRRGIDLSPILVARES
jgi:hypothetical protein